MISVFQKSSQPGGDTLYKINTNEQNDDDNDDDDDQVDDAEVDDDESDDDDSDYNAF